MAFEIRPLSLKYESIYSTRIRTLFYLIWRGFQTLRSLLKIPFRQEKHSWNWIFYIFELMVRDGLIDCCLRAVVRMIPAGVVPSRSFLSLSHRLVPAEEDQKAKKKEKMILILLYTTWFYQIFSSLVLYLRHYRFGLLQKFPSVFVVVVVIFSGCTKLLTRR